MLSFVPLTSCFLFFESERPKFDTSLVDLLEPFINFQVHDLFIICKFVVYCWQFLTDHFLMTNANLDCIHGNDSCQCIH
jgi:hypothetical protein